MNTLLHTAKRVAAPILPIEIYNNNNSNNNNNNKNNLILKEDILKIFPFANVWFPAMPLLFQAVKVDNNKNNNNSNNIIYECYCCCCCKVFHGLWHPLMREKLFNQNQVSIVVVIVVIVLMLLLLILLMLLFLSMFSL